MSTANLNSSTIAGTASGTLLSLSAFISDHDLVKSAVLAAIGAIVSFTISVLLNWLKRKFFPP